MNSLCKYVKLLEPGYLLSSCSSAVAGFLLGSSGRFEYVLFLATIASVGLLSGAGIVFSKYIYHYRDNLFGKKNGQVELFEGLHHYKALAFAAALGCIGLAIIFLSINIFAFMALSFGGVMYFGLSSFMTKRFKWGRYFTNIPHAFIVLYGFLTVTGEISYGAIQLLVAVVVFYLVLHVALLSSLLGLAGVRVEA